MQLWSMHGLWVLQNMRLLYASDLHYRSADLQDDMAVSILVYYHDDEGP